MRGTALQKWQMPTAVEDKDEKRRAAEANWRTVCKAVSLREGYRCRVCDKQCANHHHHIVYRSRGGEDTVENVCLLCLTCHDQEHVSRTLSIEGDAEKGLAIWRRADDQSWFLWRQETGVRVYIGAI